MTEKVPLPMNHGTPYYQPENDLSKFKVRKLIRNRMEKMPACPVLRETTILHFLFGFNHKIFHMEENNFH